MGRRERVLQALESLTREAIPSINGNDGFTTDEVAKRADLLRTNCSTELNMLVRSGQVVKQTGRPARYVLQLQSAVAEHLQAHSGEMARADSNRNSDTVQEFATPEGSQASFDWGVATQRSLHDAVQQAKLALTYPPSGMHVLLLGETGVGKSTFSRKMHQYAVQHGVLPELAPFVSFNCSEYAYNPEILLDQLFGHVRGAYTGAHSEKAGLVEQADGGMLFLDEVHRLSPQGQEMLFHLIDYGRFRRLGETQVSRQARILLVAATTESPESVLLSTFRRRIPMVIRLPALREWTLYDRYELLYTLCRDEARVLGKPISISAPALDKLLFSHFAANIGDLKNSLKLACARAYGGSSRADVVALLPEHVLVAPGDGPNLSLLRRLSRTSDLLVLPNGVQPPAFSALAERSRYATLERLSRTLQDLGFDTEEILAALERELLRRDETEEAAPPSLVEFQRFVGEPFYTWMTRAWDAVQRHNLDAKQAESAFVRVGMHLFGAIRSGPQERETLPEFVGRVQMEYPELYDLASRLLRTFSAESGVVLPAQAISVVALLLRPNVGEPVRRAGLVVALFGDGIARQLVANAIRIAGPGMVLPVDVAVQSTMEEVTDQLLEAVHRVDEGEGVLLLTDVPWVMQAASFERAPDKDWERVFRPDLHTLIHALQAVQSGNYDLRELSAWLQANRRIGSPQMIERQARVVWACCLTGKGTARAVQRLIAEALPADLKDRVQIVPKELARAAGGSVLPIEGLVAAVGSVNPEVLGVPYFSVEELLSRDGLERLLNVLYVGDSVFTLATHDSPSPPESVDKEFATSESSYQPEASPTRSSEANEWADKLEQHIRTLLQRDLVFVNPDLAVKAAKNTWNQICQRADMNPPAETLARFCLHIAYVIERLVRNEGLLHPYVEQLETKYPSEWEMMLESWKPVEDAFRLPVNRHELAYLFEIVFADRRIEVFDS